MQDKIRMTPLKIEILLWYYSSPHDYPNMGAPAVIEAIEEFCNAGILYYITNPNSDQKIGSFQDALDVYINELLQVPLPKQIWVCQKDKA